MDEEKKNGILEEPPKEEELSAADPRGPAEDVAQEKPQEETEEPQSDWNYQIPYAVAEIAWPESPAQRAKYINTVAPVLNLIQFHTCLGPAGQLPPTARLIIGCAAIVGGVVMIKVGQAKKEKDVKKEGTGTVLREKTEKEKDDQLSSSEKEKASGNGSQQQRASGFRKSDPSLRPS